MGDAGQGASARTTVSARSRPRSVSTARPASAARGEVFRVRPRVLDVPPPHGAVPRADVRVRARADAPPVPAAPVGEVVPARVGLGAGPVAHLVPAQPGGGQHLVGELVHGGLVVGVRLGQLAPAHLDGHPRARLDDERVRGHVVHAERRDGLERAAPVVERLPRRAVDEVERDGQARVARPADHVGDARGVVRAVERGEHVRDRRLHAERDAREPRGGERGQRRGVDGVGVRLRGDLRAGLEAPRVRDGAQEAGEVGHREERRRPAAEEHGAHRPCAPGVGEHAAGQVDLCDGGARVGRLVGPAAELGRRVRVEVAVPAAHPAEGHVHVDAERAVGVRRTTRPAADGGRPGRVAHPGRQRAVVGHGLAVGQDGRAHGRGEGTGITRPMVPLRGDRPAQTDRPLPLARATALRPGKKGR